MYKISSFFGVWENLVKKQFLKILWSEVWKEGFHLIQILGLLCMYFDAVVVFVTNNSLLFRLAVAILCNLGPIFLTANKLVFFIVTLKLQNRCYIILYTATRSIRGRSYVDACFEDYQIIIFLSMGCHWTQYIYQDSKIFPTLHQYCPSNSYCSHQM